MRNLFSTTFGEPEGGNFSSSQASNSPGEPVNQEYSSTFSTTYLLRELRDYPTASKDQRKYPKICLRSFPQGKGKEEVSAQGQERLEEKSRSRRLKTGREVVEGSPRGPTTMLD